MVPTAGYSAIINLEDYNVLIVDDTPVNLGVIVTFLEDCGLGIRIARSGESALKRIHYDMPDIILLDVLMPGMDGFETCRQLKADPRTRDIPIIFMTSLSDVENKVKGFEFGAVDYVTKPLHQNEVLARISTHLQLQELTRRLKSENNDLRVTSEREKDRLLNAVKQQREQLRVLNDRMNHIKEEEHKHLARELHDELGQTLTAININLSTIRKELGSQADTTILSRLEETEALTQHTLDQVRELSINLRPAMLDDLGLLPTVKWYVKRFGERLKLKTDLQLRGESIRRLPSKVEITLFRIIQEGLTNIAKHANATHVTVSLIFSPHRVALELADNGRGFDVDKTLHPDNPDLGTGLLGIRERVILLNGQIEISSHPDHGTALRLQVPIQESNGAGELT